MIRVMRQNRNRRGDKWCQAKNSGGIVTQCNPVCNNVPWNPAKRRPGNELLVLPTGRIGGTGNRQGKYWGPGGDEYIQASIMD